MVGTEALDIVIGVLKAPGDINSAEQGVDVISLYGDETDSGFVLDPAANWQPVIPSLKGGGAWIESSLEDGRVLASDAVANVIETIPLILTSPSETLFWEHITHLNRFIARARRLWATDYEIEPVYLHWWAKGAPGPQFALISDIQVAITFAHGAVGEQSITNVKLTVEREAAWRMEVPPGAPPTLWARYANRHEPGADFDFDDLDLHGVNDSAIVAATVRNRHEFDAATSYEATPLSKNWIDIDGDDIPGDAPALLSVGYSYDSNVDARLADFYVARSTKPRTLRTRQGNNRPQFFILNAGDAEMGTGFTKQATADATLGVISNGSSIQRYYAEASATGAKFIRWGIGTANYGLAWNSFRGRFAVYARVQTNATDSEWDLWITDPIGNELAQLTRTVTKTIAGKQTLYLGDITLPIDKALHYHEREGYGLEVNDMQVANTEFGFSFRVTLNTAVSHKITDLVLIPYDEWLHYTTVDFSLDVHQVGRTVIDSTGYQMHGKRGTQRTYLNNTGAAGHELRGPKELTLIPGLDNRLYFLFAMNEAAGLPARESQPDGTGTYYVNIVPRCYGVRSDARPFQPPVFPDDFSITAWYDADDSSTLWQDSGRTTPAASDTDPVGAWDDKSGNGYHVIQATAGSRPTLQTGELNSKSVIRFDGTDDSLRNAAFTDFGDKFTAFAVVSHASAGSADDTQGVFEAHSGTSDSGFALIHGTNGSVWRARDASGSAISVLGSQLRDSTWHIHTGDCTGNLLRYWLDTAFVGSTVYTPPNPNTLTTLDVGRFLTANWFMWGDIAELIIFDKLLIDRDREIVEDYLKSKWSL